MFSVDETLRSGSQSPGQMPDELVPSRYALRVGDIDVLLISDGVFPLPATTLATNADPAELAAWLDGKLQPSDVYKWPLNVVVVRSGGRTILIDSGMGEEYPDFPRAGGLLAHRLEHAGIDLASVTDVVLTHVHVDHVGGLLADGLKSRLRPDVPIHVAAAEVEFWESPDFSRNTFGGMPDVLRSAAKRFLDEYRSQLRPFDAEYEVAPGVVVCRTGGHTPGHSVVRLASGGDRLTFLGDAVFPDHFDRPDWYNAFDHDPEEAVRVRIRLLRELAATREPLVATHLSFPSLGRVALAGDVFRWVPGNWDY
ncbi:MBL fold metallo-hydrolase [Variovorax sp. WS11]|uniref:MBL fold metallo-hydrolase n=1 Tax=Variovorax sp. WS11 TaxID=1105204 RepID=UPI000D0D5992|nr:MBL fold metallo-hydrolase [Variovorax sp. WS11]NDZ15590.1 MBL fold metallo-hydrolase [Variovorax sp. WS11]PSL83424.1 MBL fold metallo-hydrolase [Variovorax sp. WS11]